MCDVDLSIRLLNIVDTYFFSTWLTHEKRLEGVHFTQGAF